MDIQTLIDKAGGERDFQTLCDVARTTVLDWKRSGQLPANRVAQVAAALDLPINEVIKLAPPPAQRRSKGSV